MEKVVYYKGEKVNTNYKEFTNQKQWKLYLKWLITNNDKALLKSIITIFKNQEEDEQVKGKTMKENGKGFSKVDAEFLSGLAIKILAKKELQWFEIKEAKYKMVKYWKQLMIESKKKLLKNQENQKSLVNNKIQNITSNQILTDENLKSLEDYYLEMKYSNEENILNEELKINDEGQLYFRLI